MSRSKLHRAKAHRIRRTSSSKSLNSFDSSPSKRSWIHRAKFKGPSKSFLGIALVIIGGLLLWPNQSKNKPLVSAESPIKMEGFQGNNSEESALPQRVLIPTVGIDLPIAKAKIFEGYWEVFEDKAAWGEGSGVPGQIGNQVIFAHAREGLFLPLRDIKKDEMIYVLTENSWFTYKITDIKEVYPNQIEVVAPTTDETLTLYTCTGFQDSQRLIVVAKRLDTL